MAFTYRYREHEGQVKDWLRLIYSWLVGLSVSGAGILLWDWLVNESLHQELYVQGLAAISVAGLTAGLTYWRGQQTREQIEKAQGQIEAAQRQTRYQSLNDAIQMAVDDENLLRARAGWGLLHLWFSDEREGTEDARRYQKMIRNAAHNVLLLDAEVEEILDQELEQLQEKSSKQSFLESAMETVAGLKKTPIQLVLGSDTLGVRLKKSEAKRSARDVRQQAFDFFVEVSFNEAKQWRQRRAAGSS